MRQDLDRELLDLENRTGLDWGAVLYFVAAVVLLLAGWGLSDGG